jgi:hypothetical protein
MFMFEPRLIDKITEGDLIQWSDIIPEQFVLLSIFGVTFGSGVLFRLWLSLRLQPT